MVRTGWKIWACPKGERVVLINRPNKTAKTTAISPSVTENRCGRRRSPYGASEP